MRIDNCEFPDDLLYDEDGLVWLRPEPSGEVTLGITAIQAALAGRLTKVTPKAVGAEYARGRTIGLLEGGKYFGAIRTPLDATLIVVNDAAVARPKLLSEEPYRGGWYARLKPANAASLGQFLRAKAMRDALAGQIAALHVHCYAAFPDYEMFEIGTECAAVLVKLEELVERIEPGEVVHIVSDDWTAPVEMENWSLRTRHPVIESRKEGNLFHFLVRKAR